MPAAHALISQRGRLVALAHIFWKALLSRIYRAAAHAEIAPSPLPRRARTAFSCASRAQRVRASCLVRRCFYAMRLPLCIRNLFALRASCRFMHLAPVTTAHVRIAPARICASTLRAHHLCTRCRSQGRLAALTQHARARCNNTRREKKSHLPFSRIFAAFLGREEALTSLHCEKHYAARRRKAAREKLALH